MLIASNRAIFKTTLVVLKIIRYNHHSSADIGTHTHMGQDEHLDENQEDPYIRLLRALISIRALVHILLRIDGMTRRWLWESTRKSFSIPKTELVDSSRTKFLILPATDALLPFLQQIQEMLSFFLRLPPPPPKDNQN